MDNISQNGAEAFLTATLSAVGSGLILPHVAEARFRNLQDLIGPYEPAMSSAVDAYAFGWGHGRFTPAAVADITFADPPRSTYSEDPSSTTYTFEFVALERTARASGSGPRNPDVAMLFTVRPSEHRLSRTWAFHPTDNDPYPSVPHGHDGRLGDGRLKLDAYLGHIFERGRPVDRESRQSIISLWNDADFRVFALGAIRYMVDHDSTFLRRLLSDRQIARPLRLPSKRSGHKRKKMH